VPDLLRSWETRKVCDRRRKESKCSRADAVCSTRETIRRRVSKSGQRLAQTISVSASTARNVCRDNSALALSQGGIARRYVLVKDNQSVRDVTWFSCEATFYLDAYIIKSVALVRERTIPTERAAAACRRS
jgi:hypothetical protein